VRITLPDLTTKDELMVEKFFRTFRVSLEIFIQI
jgi:hypothetical protein